jgi:hypothetical protein
MEIKKLFCLKSKTFLLTGSLFLMSLGALTAHTLSQDIKSSSQASSHPSYHFKKPQKALTAYLKLYRIQGQKDLILKPYLQTFFSEDRTGQILNLQYELPSGWTLVEGVAFQALPYQENQDLPFLKINKKETVEKNLETILLHVTLGEENYSTAISLDQLEEIESEQSLFYRNEKEKSQSQNFRLQKEGGSKSDRFAPPPSFPQPQQ